MIIKGMSNAKVNEAKAAIGTLINRKGITLKAIALAALALLEAEEMKCKVIAMRKNGMSIKAISKELHVRDRRISAIVRDYSKDMSGLCHNGS